MDKRTFDFSGGVFMLVVAFVFFILLGFLNLDTFIQFVFALRSFVIGISFSYMGYTEK